MTIKEVEERTGLTRSNVRFYEKEKLIAPSRNENNSYRDYSERDVEDIKKIAYLRTLGISIEDIRKVMSKETTLQKVIERQSEVLKGQIAALAYAGLPPEIPVQWSDGVVSALVDKKCIFVYPAVCIAIRYLLRPLIYAKLQMYNRCGEIVTEYLTNYMCFIALSIEVFSILFIFHVVKNIVIFLFLDTAVLIGLLLVGIAKMGSDGRKHD